MRIRHLLIAGIALTFGLVATRFVLLERSMRESARLNQAQLDIERISRDAASLLVLSQDYLLHQSPRSRRQWRAVHAELATTLPRLRGSTPEMRDPLDTLSDVTTGLGPLFDAVETAVAGVQRTANVPQMEMLSDSLVAETRRISDGAFEVAEQLVDLRRLHEQSTHRATVVVTLGFALLIVALSFIVLRRVLRPMRSLQAASQAVEAGDLGARSGYRARDEFGELSARFDSMTGTLQEREALLAAARRDLRNILDAVPSLIGYWDHQLICRFANQAYAEWFGIDPDRMPGKHITALLGRKYVEDNRVWIDAALRGEPQSFERSFPRQGGGVSRQSLARYLPDVTDGVVQGFYVLVFDVTPLKQAQQEMEVIHAALEERTRQAEAANLAKSQFLTNMSHEIRTPMNAVMGLSYLLGRTPLNGDQAELLRKLRTAGRSLLGNINNVLDLSKIEADELRLETLPFNPQAVLDNLASVMHPLAQAKGLDLKFSMACDVPPVLEGDVTRLNQVLGNLIANAVKFSARGSVQLDVRRCADDGPGALLRFEVQDNGIGIEPQAQARLFEPFMQADLSTTRRFGGTGLGLSIVKRLVGLMGGEVRLDSTPGVGSCFTVTMRFQLSTDEALRRFGVRDTGQALAGLVGVRVLVVDDSEINLGVARRMLELEGARVEVARDGLQAVNLLREQPEVFDVVLMDVQMPTLDGHGATRLIRQELGLAALPVIALTAGALTSQYDEAIAAGMSDFLTKPFEAHELVRCIRRHLPPSALPRMLAVPTADTPFVPPPSSADALAWPVIAGMDGAVAAQRLGGDVGLLRAMLRRLLAEFATAFDGIDALPAAPEARAALAGTLHKLCGSAGLLGLHAIHQLAGDGEACVRGAQAGIEPVASTGASDAAAAAPALGALLSDLRQHLAALQAASDSWLQEPAAGDPVATDSGPVPLDADGLAALREALALRDLAALDLFKTLAPGLRGHLGGARFAAFQRSLEDLEFAQAFGLLTTAGAEAARDLTPHPAPAAAQAKAPAHA